MPESLRRETSSRQIPLPINNLWGREKIKFDHLDKTKDLAATTRETKDGNLAFLKPNRNQGPPPWHAPRGGSIDLSQLNSILPAGFVLPVAGPAIGKTTLLPGFAVRSGLSEPTGPRVWAKAMSLPCTIPLAKVFG